MNLKLLCAYYSCVDSCQCDHMLKLKVAHFFQQLPKKKTTEALNWKVPCFKISPESQQIIGLHFIENLQPRSFKNHPMWSHSKLFVSYLIWWIFLICLFTSQLLEPVVKLQYFCIWAFESAKMAFSYLIWLSIGIRTLDFQIDG